MGKDRYGNTWSGDFPPPGAGDGRVRPPGPQLGCLRVVAPAVVIVLALIWALVR